MKVCLVGSTKFKDMFQRANLELSRQGHIVYSVAGFGHSGDILTEREKELLDLVHLRKLLESEVAVVITNVEFYIGDSTRRELLWCRILGDKGPIIRLFDPTTGRATWDHNPRWEATLREIFPETSI